uniref:Uncharacterized protein n=1 Tax=viral metagenome TaxID=1070528 RepID=A0A6M3L4C4_9ZZZZ
MANELAVIGNLADTMKLGQVLAESGFFSDSRGASQAIVKILAGRELGFGPVASMTGVNIIKGKVALSANLIAASIKRSGRYNYRVKQMDNDTCSVEFYEGGQAIGVSTFTMDDAKAAGLGGDNWRKFSRNMLFARAISNGAKWYCPDLSGGPLYTPDELGAQIDGESGEIAPNWSEVEEVEFDQLPPAPRAAKPESKRQPQDDTGKKPPWPLAGPAKEFCDAVRAATDYYENQYHLWNAIGKTGNLNDKDNFDAKLSVAVDHANEKSAAKAGQQSLLADEEPDTGYSE